MAMIRTGSPALRRAVLRGMGRRGKGFGSPPGRPQHRAGSPALGECVFGPIEKIHEFGFVLRVLQLLIVFCHIYNLLLTFLKQA
jgi:hypothetical protein